MCKLGPEGSLSCIEQYMIALIKLLCSGMKQLLGNYSRNRHISRETQKDTAAASFKERGFPLWTRRAFFGGFCVSVASNGTVSTFSV